MNLPVLIVAGVMAMALIGHILIGTRETATLEPQGQTGKPMANWVQTMCAFQMLSIDLLILTVVLFLLALTDLIPAERMVILGLGGYFAAQGLLWLGHILWLRRDGATLTSLPHWLVWFVCAILMFVGA